MRAVRKSMRFVPSGGVRIQAGYLVLTALLVCGCTSPTIYHTHGRTNAPRAPRVLNTVLSWPAPADVDALKGAVVVRDGRNGVPPDVAIGRAILHTNPRITAAAALVFAGMTMQAARAQALDPEFLGATLLQESAYDPDALSAAGAIGIAQFIPETASGMGLDPYDPFASIDAAAALLGSYAEAYRGRYDDPESAALAAYNAGPLAVAQYHGVPPYAETREYIALIFERRAQIVSYERTGGVLASAWKRSRR